MSRIIKYITPILILAVGIGGFVYFKATREAPKPLETKYRAPLVSIQTVTKTSASPMVRLFGEVQTPASSVLSAAVEADIIAVNVLEGDTVIKSQEMVILDDTDIQLEILQKRAELKESEAVIESDRIKLLNDQSALVAEKTLLSLIQKSVRRARTLAKSNAGSEATLDEALQNEQRQKLSIIQRQQAIDDSPSRQQQLQARYDKAAAVLSRTERDLGRTRIKAPFEGRISLVIVSEGDRAKKGDQLVEIYNQSALELRAQVPTAHLAVIQNALDNNRAITASTIINGNVLTLDLHRLSASVATGQGGVDAFFRARDGQLPALGITLEIQLELPEIENTVVLSPDALYGMDRIYVVEDSKLKSKSIRVLGKLIDEAGKQQIIIDGESLEEGELILKSRLPQAISGLVVDIVD